MTWRYQPIITTDSRHRPQWIALHEVYLHDDGTLKAWSKEPIAPGGETMEELCTDLRRMLSDAQRWRPEQLSKLKPSMKFFEASQP